MPDDKPRSTKKAAASKPAPKAEEPKPEPVELKGVSLDMVRKPATP